MIRPPRKRRRCSSGVEQLIRNEQVVGSNPTSGSSDIFVRDYGFPRIISQGAPTLNPPIPQLEPQIRLVLRLTFIGNRL